MLLGLMVEANGWAVALALVVIAGMIVLFWRRTGRVETKLGTIELTATEAATAAAVGAVKVEHIAQQVGTANGAGPIAQMLEALTGDVTALREGQAGMGLRMTAFERTASTRHEENAARIAALGAKISDVATRVDEMADRP